MVEGREGVMQFTWHWDGDSGVRFHRVVDGLDDTSGLMADMAQYLYNAARDNFANERSPDGIAWAPRSPATLEAYRRQGSPWGRILQKEGGLFDSLATESGRDFASVFVNRPYGAVHQFGAAKGAFGKTKRGAPIPWGNIPARPFLGVGEKQEEDIKAIVEEWFTGLGS
jgi:phage virion morphogenesis protein